MKKIINIFLVVISLITFYFTYQKIWFYENENIKNWDNKIGLQFTIPNDLALAASENIYEFITDIAKKMNVNVFRSTIKANNKDQLEYIKYVLINNDTNYFNIFKLKTGRFLIKDDLGSDLYLSTYNNSDLNQIGLLKNFAGKIPITIKPFNKFCEFLPTAGTYTIETQNKDILYKFVNELCVSIQNYYKDKFNDEIKYKPNDFFINTGINETSSLGILSLLKICLFVLVIILSMLYIYYVCQNSKQIGIMKLNGLSTIKVWYKIIASFTIKTFILINFLCLGLVFLIKDASTYFLISFLEIGFFMMLIILFSTLLSTIFIASIKPNLIIKNKDSTYVVFLMNSIVKMATFFIIFIVISIAYSKCQNLKLQYEIKNNWAKSIDYGIFYPMTVPNDREDYLHGSLKQKYRVATKLYPILNKMGSVFINAQQYEELDFIFNPQRELRYITVNNNFLNEFPVYDIYNKKINITENTKDVILLVPQKLKNHETNIINFFHQEDKEWLLTDSSNADINKENSNVQNRKFKIIFTKDNQKIFSFNTDVFPTENNIIIDPIIKVITENNSTVDEKDGLLGGGCRDPLKIKLIDRDTTLTYKTLLPYLKEYKLDDSFRTLITVDQYIATAINNIKIEINLVIGVIIFCILIILLLITQNISIYFNRYSRKIITEKLLGFDFKKIYFRYIIFIISTSIFQLIIFLFVNSYLNKHIRNILDNINIDLPLFFILCFVSILEIVIFIPVILKLETKNVIKVLKGD